MDEKKNQVQNSQRNTDWYGVRADDGEMFPFPMTAEEYAYFLKLCEEEEKNSKK